MGTPPPRLNLFQTPWPCAVQRPHERLYDSTSVYNCCANGTACHNQNSSIRENTKIPEKDEHDESQTHFNFMAPGEDHKPHTIAAIAHRKYSLISNVEPHRPPHGNKPSGGGMPSVYVHCNIVGFDFRRVGISEWEWICLIDP